MIKYLFSPKKVWKLNATLLICFLYSTKKIYLKYIVTPYIFLYVFQVEMFTKFI